MRWIRLLWNSTLSLEVSLFIIALKSLIQIEFFQGAGAKTVTKETLRECASSFVPLQPHLLSGIGSSNQNF